MSNLPPPNQYSPQPQVFVQQHAPPQNGLGIAGFITSLVGWVSCGLLSPIGLILSLIALSKRPRGFAIAGTVIGALGSIFLAVVGLGIVMAALGIGMASKLLGDYANAHSSARAAYLEIDALRKQSGTTPDSATASRIARKHTDPWGEPFNAEEEGGAITIMSSGRDKKFGTRDDLQFHEANLQSATPSTMPDFGEDAK